MRPPLDWAEIDAYVERFERGRAADPGLEARACLPAADHPLWLEVLRELACVEMELQARAGSEPELDAYRARYPELFDDPEARLVLARQELRLRAGAGETPSDTPALGGWHEQAVALFEEHRLREDAGPPTALVGSPGLVRSLVVGAKGQDFVDCRLVPGGEWAGFRLVEELGRGTFGKVFLAEQKGLAGRPVALKIGEGLHHESQALARLQHTHIMPIHSVHRVGELVGVCMPYLGRATLADVLGGMRAGGPPPSGNALYSTLRGQVTHPATGEVPAAPGASTPDPLATLRGLDQPRAVLWLGARLADGLAHAHERGVLHRDLKPANVLLTDEGQPLLLDFNLAADLPTRGRIPAVLGGTLPYMAPEHLDAFQGGSRPVDERSDLYSLGVILHELLTGRHPFPQPKLPLPEMVAQMLADRLAGPPLPPSVLASPAVAAILRRCLEPDPAKRYVSARHLQEDAQRQLDDLPLRHTAEPSWLERAAKWRRRNPRQAWAALAVLLLVLLVGGAAYHVARSRDAAQAEAVAAVRLSSQDLREASVRLNQPFLNPKDLDDGHETCRRALARLGLTGDQEKPLPWLPPQEQPALEALATEVLLLSARALSLKAKLEPARSDEFLEEAIAANERAGRLAAEGQRRAVLTQHAALLRAAGRRAEADEMLAQAREVQPVSGRDHYLLAGEKMAAGELAEARRLLREASRLQPDSASVWAALGNCESADGRFERAVGCFTTAIALLPELWWVRLWRGQANLERQEYADAEEDFASVLALRPDFAPAHVLRALARMGRKDHKGAESDLATALRLEGDNTRIYFLRARARNLAGDDDGARRDHEEGLRRLPSDELSWVTRGHARMQDDPKGGLADFDEALKLNPFSREASQNKAHVLSEHLGRVEDAVAVLDHRLARYPEDALVRAGRGVLLARLGRREAAVNDARIVLTHDTSPLIDYQAGCVYALTSAKNPDDRDEAFRLLRRALLNGFGADHLETDPDLKAIRKLPRFRELSAFARTVREKR